MQQLNQSPNLKKSVKVLEHIITIFLQFEFQKIIGQFKKYKYLVIRHFKIKKKTSMQNLLKILITINRLSGVLNTSKS